jgi:predicted RNA-binding Zn ribbon-like protein
MARLQGLSPSEARRFRTGRACLDFCHTGGDGPLARFELLVDADSLAWWLGVVLETDGIVVGPDSLAATRSLRGAIWAAAHDLIAGRTIQASSRRTINAVAEGEPCAPQLGADGTIAFARPIPVDQVLSSLARDAIDLFGGPLAGRIRVCEAADCRLLFVDQSRPGGRRWCSMQRCGNLAKVRRHRSAGQTRQSGQARQ